MSQENVEIVRRMFDAFNEGALNPEDVLEYFTDDIDYRAVEGAPDDHGPVRGKEALRAYAQDWLDTFDNLRPEPVDLIDAGDDKVIAVIRISGRAKLSGVETDLTYAALYTFRAGKIARGREYWTRAEALEAAGLSE
jgi:ketosteroid isomerase-like protein